MNKFPSPASKSVCWPSTISPSASHSEPLKILRWRRLLRIVWPPVPQASLAQMLCNIDDNIVKRVWCTWNTLLKKCTEMLRRPWDRQIKSSDRQKEPRRATWGTRAMALKCLGRKLWLQFSSRAHTHMPSYLTLEFSFPISKRRGIQNHPFFSRRSRN